MHWIELSLNIGLTGRVRKWEVAVRTASGTGMPSPSAAWRRSGGARAGSLGAAYHILRPRGAGPLTGRRGVRR